MSKVVWTSDLDAIEVVALARLAANPDAVPPPHVRSSLQHRGWLLAESGRMKLSPHANSLITQLVSAGSCVSAGLANR